MMPNVKVAWRRHGAGLRAFGEISTLQKDLSGSEMWCDTGIVDDFIILEFWNLGQQFCDLPPPPPPQKKKKSPSQFRE